MGFLGMGMSEEVTGWELAYQGGHTRESEAHEEAEWLTELFRKHAVGRILDLGCGDGRHLVWFASRGFEMFGLDSAPTAVCLAQEFLARAGLSAEVQCGDMTELPWSDDFFDAVISVQVLNHQDIDDIRRTIREIRRVLRPGAWLFVTVATYRPEEPRESDKLVKLGKKLYTKKRGHEAGVPHYFATELEWVIEFASFEIMEVHWDRRRKTTIRARQP